MILDKINMYRKTKNIYFITGSLKKHMGIYKSWIDQIKQSSIKKMELLTIMNFKTFLNQYELTKYYKKSDNLKILISPFRILKPFFVILYFLFLIFQYDRIVIHVRKQTTIAFDILKLFTNKIKYIIEFEGDIKSEINYLKKHPFKEGFYDETIKKAKRDLNKIPRLLKRADHILTVTEELKELFMKRYHWIDLKEKISSIPTGFDKNKFYFDPHLRQRIRSKMNLTDKVVLIYTGNVFTSWQNLKRTLEVFKLIKNQKNFENMFLLLLILKEDQHIANHFINKVGLKDSDYLMKNVKYEAVNGYLNASDLGILLRDDHQMNHVCCPGKLGEYLGAGLLVLTTVGIGRYSKALKKSKMGIVLNNFWNDKIIIKTFNDYKNEFSRTERSQWAHKNFSAQVFKTKYVNVMENLGNT